MKRNLTTTVSVKVLEASHVYRVGQIVMVSPYAISSPCKVHVCFEVDCSPRDDLS